MVYLHIKRERLSEREEQRDGQESEHEIDISGGKHQVLPMMI